MSDQAPSQSAFSQSLDKMPWWAQFIVLVAMTFGVPVVMIGWYLARDSGYIANPLVEEVSTLAGSVEEVKGVTLRHEETMRGMIEIVKEDIARRQKRCVMRARTDTEKAACFVE